MPRLLIIALLAVLSACATVRIPEARSPEAQLYAARCGQCHAAPHPGRQFFEQWQRLMVLIERQIVHTTMEPLSAQERDTILAYLNKHAREKNE